MNESTAWTSSKEKTAHQTLFMCRSCFSGSAVRRNLTVPPFHRSTVPRSSGSPPATRTVGGRRRIIILFRDSKHLRHRGIALDAHHTLRDVIAHRRRELRTLGIATRANPDVLHLRVFVDDE